MLLHTRTCCTILFAVSLALLQPSWVNSRSANGETEPRSNQTRKDVTLDSDAANTRLNGHVVLNTTDDKFRPSGATESKKPELLSADAWPQCTLQFWQDTKKCGFEVPGMYESFIWVGPRCVWMDTRKVSWAAAVLICADQGQGVELATPKDKSVGTVQGITAAFNRKEDKFWVGYDDVETPGCYKSVRDTKRCARLNSNILIHTLPNNDKHCLAAVKARDYRFGRTNCMDKLFYICDEDQESIEQTKITITDPPSEMFVGDKFTLKIEYTTLIDDQLRFGLTDNTDSTILDYSYTIGENTSYTGYFDKHPFESIESTDWVFDHEQKRRRCKVFKTISLHLLAQQDHTKLKFIYYKNSVTPEVIKSWDISIIFGHYFPTMIKPQEGRLMNRGDYSFKCVMRLGSDLNGRGVLGIINKNQDGNAEYMNNTVHTWIISYYVKNCTVSGEKGVVPDNLNINEVTCGEDAALSGYHINITFQLQGVIGPFHLRQIICLSDTEAERQIGGTPQENTVTTFDINIKFVPRTPVLKVLWSKNEGDIIAGGTVRAECSAFIGTLSYPPAIVWRMFARGMEEARDMWEVQYPFANNTRVSGVTFSGRPGSDDCKDADMINMKTTKCVRVIKDVKKTWGEAQQYCTRQFGYNLLIIETADEFRQMMGKTDFGGYWIGLNDRRKEGEYRWWDGTEGNIDDWGYRSDHQAYVGLEQYTDCVVLQSYGLDSIHCDTRKPFICQLRIDLPSSDNFDPYLGPIWTSVATFDVNNFDWLQGAQLDCSVRQNSTIDANGTVAQGSSRTTPFRYAYLPLKPTITSLETQFHAAVWVDLTCTAVVALDDGTVMWVMKQSDGVVREWLVKSKDDVFSTNPHDGVTVEVLMDTHNKDSGRRIKSKMSIKVHKVFHKSEVACYSFAWNTSDGSNDEADHLKATHAINLRKLENISYQQLEKIYGKGFLTDDGGAEVDWASAVAYYKVEFVIFLVVFIIFTLIMLVVSRTENVIKRLSGTCGVVVLVFLLIMAVGVGVVLLIRDRIRKSI